MWLSLTRCKRAACSLAGGGDLSGGHPEAAAGGPQRAQHRQHQDLTAGGRVLRLQGRTQEVLHGNENCRLPKGGGLQQNRGAGEFRETAEA